MLQEAIYKFKASGPMLLPELIDNYWIAITPGVVRAVFLKLLSLLV